MTLDEAIKHAEEVADEKENEGKLLCQSEGASIGCLTCAEEHRQLAEWLRELKQIRNALDKIRAEIAEYKDDKLIHAERNEMIDILLEIIDRHLKEGEE